jgi:hypothetical protein
VGLFLLISTLSEAALKRSGQPLKLDRYRVGEIGIDRWVLDRVFALDESVPAQDSRLPNASGFRQFRLRLKEVTAPEPLQQFAYLAAQVFSGRTGPATESAVVQIRSYPGGELILTNRSSTNLAPIFQNEFRRRFGQLKSHKFIAGLPDGPTAGTPALSAAATARTGRIPATNESEILRLTLRDWELGGSRFFLTHAGSPAIGRLVHTFFGGKGRPVYQNALNAMLDPVQRRFQTRRVFDTAPDGSSLVPRASENPEQELDSAVALLEFSGALPPAKLFADWRTVGSAAAADEILFAPGFNPHALVIVTGTALPEPKQPANTGSLPAVHIESPLVGTHQIQIAPIAQNTVLLLTGLAGSAWSATVGGHPVSLLDGNNRAPAFYLPAADVSRSINLRPQSPLVNQPTSVSPEAPATSPAPTSPFTPFTVLVTIVVALAAVLFHRRAAS